MIVVESDLVIRVLRGNRAACQWYSQLQKRDDLACSVITSYEVLEGATLKQLPTTEKLLSSLEELPVTNVIAWKAAEEYRYFRKQNQTLSMEDLLIGCTARHYGYSLATYNRRHHPLSGLVLLDP
jgi:predicted nucleic acid-binding protein